MTDFNKCEVHPIDSRLAGSLVITHHYLHRAPKISFAFGLINPESGEVLGVVTFGSPPSQHLQISACRQMPNVVIELNRVWVHDKLPRNTESWFLAQVLNRMPPRIIVSYADTSKGHLGYMYRASNFHYAGWTDMERKNPRFDYIVSEKHSRSTFRDGQQESAVRVPRKPKIKYWTVTGNKREKKFLRKICTWPIMSWVENPPPIEHKKFKEVNERHT